MWLDLFLKEVWADDNHKGRPFRALLLYAMSDQYFLARYESGLGERPYLFA